MSNLYLLALLPPPQLSEEIHAIRLECSEKFGVYKALRPPVHITLYRPFRTKQAFENQLNPLLQHGTAGITSFTQELENFGSFSKKVVFINAIKSPELVLLHKVIVSIIRENHIDEQEDNQNIDVFNPHITIAYRDVSPKVFTKIWQEYKDRKFKRSFTADHYTLLKNEKGTWIPIEDFSLEVFDQSS